MKISRTTDERYHEMLEVLPPQATSFTDTGKLNGFLVGEASTLNKYASFFAIGDNFYEGEIISEEDFKKFSQLDDKSKLEDEEEPTGEIAKELELIDELGEDVVKAGKEAGIPLDNIEEAYQGEIYGNTNNQSNNIMITYHNRTIFKLECEKCHKVIYPSESYAIEYYNTKTKKNIDVLEAYKLRTTEKESKVFCLLCKPFRR